MALPVMMVQGRALPEVWEKSLLILWEGGIRVRTEYDREGDEPSIDCTMIMVVDQPMSEPRLHLALPCSFKDLEKYRLEVVDGVHDHWIAPEEGKWTYTYHQRLFDYDCEGKKIDQISMAIERLARVPHTRRAQAITWNVALDPRTDDPPCLQRLWFRCLADREGKMRLNVNAHWRSRDAYKAAFMNMFALTDLQARLASALSDKAGVEVNAGQYVDISDSYHIYGAYFADFKDRFLKAVAQREYFSTDPGRSRTIRSDDERVQREAKAARDEIQRERSEGR
jgi:thymidylate synthase